MTREWLDRHPWLWELVVMRRRSHNAVEQARWAIRHGDRACNEAWIVARDGPDTYKLAKLVPDKVYDRSVGCWNYAIRAGIVAC